MKALQVDGRKLIEEREYRHAVHHRGFKQEALALFRGQIAEFAVAVHDRAFISRDGVGSMFECGVDVVDGRLAGFNVERCCFEQDVGLRCLEPIANIAEARIRLQRLAGGCHHAGRNRVERALRLRIEGA